MEDTNGEISCSVEETNKIRISLGLKPLRLEKKKDNVIDGGKIELEKRRQNDIKKQLERSKNKRKLKQKLSGQSMGEMLMEKGKTDASDWVESSRKKMKKGSKVSKLNTKYEQEELEGMKVAHDSNKFEEGSTVILTLKDASVLDNDDVNLEEDVLENVEMSAEDRRKFESRKAKRAAMPAYSAYEDGDGLRSKKLLAQYDEAEEMIADTMVLGRKGEYEQTGMLEKELPKGVVSVKSLKMQMAKDYYTQDEMVAFHKPKKMRKKKKLRKKMVLDELEGVQVGMEEDHGKRNGETQKDKQKEERMQRERFEVARKKANERANAFMKKNDEQMADDSVVDNELHLSMVRARRLAKLKGQKSRAQEIAESVANRPKQDTVPEGNSVVFSAELDFDARVQTAMEENAKQVEARKVQNCSTFMVEESKEDEHKSQEEQNSDSEDDEWTTDQPLVGSGMGATLALLQTTGDLKNSEMPRQAGRANDSRDKDENAVSDGIKLEYRDEFGRVMTKKEAFRQISYRFHGQKPGRKKQEKRLKQLKEELVKDKKVSGEGSTNAMKALEKRQKHFGQAHVVLSGH